ncbi:MAG: hypothetical protein ACM32J_07320 [Rhizobacter sp.]
MKFVRFEFDLADAATPALFSALPQALREFSVAIDLWPATPAAGHPSEPWVRLMWACAPDGATPGRWVCEQVIARWQAESLDAVSASLLPARDPAAVRLPPLLEGGHPVFVLDERRFTGEAALASLVTALRT